jgi:antitoxin PrlF
LTVHITVVMFYDMSKLAESRLTVQGQISVPAEVRRRLGLTAGSVLEWDLEDDQIVVRRATRYSSADVHEALFARTPPKRTVKELKAAAAEYIKKKHARR